MNGLKFGKMLPNRQNQTWRLAVLSMLILVPFYIVSFFFYQRTVAELHKEVNAFLLETLTQLEMNISYKLNAIRDMSNVVAVPELRQYLSKNDAGEIEENIGQQISDYHSLENLIELNLKKNSDIDNIRLFVDNRYMFSREKVRFFQIDQLAAEPWYRQWISENKQMLWKSTYMERLPSVATTNEHIFSAVRLVHPMENLEDIVGVLFIDVTENRLYSMISSLTQRTNGRAYIVDQDGYIISAADKSQIGKPLVESGRWKEIGSEPEGFATIAIDETSMVVVHKQIPVTGWHIVDAIPENMLQQSISRYRIALNFITVVFVIIVLLLSISSIYAIISGKITLSIRRINRAMKSHTPEYMGSQAHANNGIGKLELSIHQMIDTIRNLTEQSYEAKLRVKEAQLKVLQAQINPHFLYNTLDTIKWMALRKQTDQLGSLVDSLAEYYRRSLNKGEEIVTLAYELKLVQVYLDIQQLRTDQPFHYELSIHESLNDCLIPKLIIQPVIENALQHGIWHREDRSGSIYLQVSSTNGQLTVSVTDNGVGMSDSKIKQITSGLTKEGNYGLYNVNERIRLFFGEQYGIDIKSEADKGTVVTLRLAVKL
ncbi:sensor histidine kinase [Paenibacillus thalictri]|uniref:sensor histidine kinase n=1 Tax=Paenibacillus thalictri TaxID=2527873 RepID=UPI0013EF5250|nr:sensor histidine kinase [Paenibacillus thalictri]